MSTAKHEAKRGRRERMAAPFILCTVLYLAPMRRARGDERLDLKTLLYQEDDSRIQVIAPSVQFETALSPTLTIRMDGVYNAISGATPTGAPPPDSVTSREVVVVPAPGGGSGRVAASPAPRDDDDDDEDERGEREDRFERRGGAARLAEAVRARRGPQFVALAGATPAPAPTPAPSGGGATTAAPSGGGTTSTRTITTTQPGTQVPKQEIEDTRVGANVELLKRVGDHMVSGMLSYSSESDYDSWGLALRDAIDFNQKNTTLLLGGAATFDQVEAFYLQERQDKTSYDVMVGLTQVLDKQTLATVNVTLGRVDGYLDDPYKVAEVNGVLVPEHRPDFKDKQILYASLTRAVVSLKGSGEVSYRFYDDSFGITGNTVGLAWYQKLRGAFILRPAVRYYRQTAADFYGVRFTGSPEFYSSDYRLSELDGFGYGLKLIWKASDRVWFDAALERYTQEGQDGFTVQDAYPQATFAIMGMRIWL